MSDYSRISELNRKISNVLETAGKHGERFSGIEKDLLAGYMRELYELVLAVQPEGNLPLQPSPASPPAMEEKVIITDKATTEQQELTALNQQPIQIETLLPDFIEEQVPVTRPEVIYRADATGNKPAADTSVKKSISEIYAEKKDNGRVTLNDRYKSQGKEIADALKHTPIRDLKSYIGLNKRVNFIHQLFNGSEQQFDDAIAKLDGFGSYHDALQFVQEQLAPVYQWRDDAPLVSEFFTLLMRRYLQ